MSTVPYVDLALQHQEIKEEILESLDQVLTRGDFVLGQEVEKFEKRFASYCNSPFALGVNSGTDALFLALKAFNIGEGDEVIIPPNSFLATASSVVAAGAKPIYVDIRTDLNIDPSLIEAAITEKTKAMIAVHLTGKPADMKPILAIAQKYDLKVIEDAAQAVGAEYYQQKVGSLGDAGCFSLHPLKTLNACGDGGMITLKDEEAYCKIKQLRNIGLKNRNECDIWGYNSRLDTMQAAILNIKLKYLDEWNNRRIQLAKLYDASLSEIVQIPKNESFEKSVYHTYVIQTPQRDQLQAYLNQHEIGSKIHYPIPIHMQVAAKRCGYPMESYPVTEECSKAILSLPVHQNLDESQVEYVIETLHKFFKR